jgi:ribosome-binding protein aMBF1 (putative translation factor)
MADRTRINLSEENEVQYWSERVGLTPERLREVVNEVGNSVERVREKLGWQKTA